MSQLDAFCTAYGIPIPRAPLSRLSHWHAMLGDLSAQERGLHDETAQVAPGYFFLATSPAPESEALHQYFAQAQSADWLLIPSVEPGLGRGRTDAAEAIIRIPFMDAAFLDTRGDLARALRGAVGRDRYKDILRLTRKAESACQTRIVQLSNSSPVQREAFAGLHALNAGKYGHPVNHYTLPVLDALASSGEAANYYLKIAYDKRSGAPLQASLSHADPLRGIFTQLVQGQDRARVPPGLNLYLSDYYQLYEFAESLGFTCHGLGRGAIEQKQRLGANRIMLLENWLLPVCTQRKQQMLQFALSRF